jgi:hypothetical protein
MESLVEATNAAVGSACSKLVVYPLDLIKTRMAKEGKSLGEVVAELEREGGGKAGLYKGIESKLIKSVTGKFFYFYLYATLSRLRSAQLGGAPLDTLSNLVVGFFSEVLELPLIMPLEAIVSKVQASKGDGLSFSAAARALYREGGDSLSKFYVSLDSYVLGAMQPAIQMSVFDQVRPLVLRGRKELSALEAFLLGTLASSIAVTLTYPMDIARTLAQTSDGDEARSGMLATLRRVVSRGGPLAVFDGLSAQLYQSVLSAAIMLVVKEKIKRYTTALLLALLKQPPPL